MAKITSKSRMPSTLQYGSWDSVVLPFTSFGSPSIITYPNGLATKIIAVSYYVHIVTPGLSILNVEEGPGTAYEGSGARSSYGYVDLGGTFVTGDKITVTIAGVAYTHVVSGRETTLAAVAAGLSSQFNYMSGFNTLYRANSLLSEFVIQTLTYSTATPTFTVSVVSSAGTATANGANMVAGVAGAVPSQPVLDQTGIGIVPSNTTLPGNTLFPVDIILPTFSAGNNNSAGTVYAIENHDAIWPPNAPISVIMSGPSGSASATPRLYTIPFDNNPMMPEQSNNDLRISLFHL